MEPEQRVLPLTFILTGTFNVLLIKWSDTLQGECSDGKWRQFQHPVVQTMLMFLAELLCFIVYKIVYFFLQRRADGSENEHLVTRGGREFSPLTLLLPALLDAVASVLLFTGLYLTYASSFQMLRGAAIIFSGIFSAIYLNQRLIARHWMALFTIACAITVVLSIDVQRVYYDRASLSAAADENSILSGEFLILCAQVFHAAQYVYEEKHLKGSDIPAMQAVGWQGIFGLAITAVLAVCMHFLPAGMPFADNSRGVFDDLGDAVLQLHSNPWLLLALGLFVVSCAIYNYAALSIVKFSSTANRLMADGLRIIFIWLGALFLRWEDVNLISVMGFIILEMGVIAYRNAIFIEWYRRLLAHLARRRYTDLSVDAGNEAGSGVPSSRPADVI